LWNDLSGDQYLAVCNHSSSDYFGAIRLVDHSFEEKQKIKIRNKKDICLENFCHNIKPPKKLKTQINPIPYEKK
jgi:hypothetical protein